MDLNDLLSATRTAADNADGRAAAPSSGTHAATQPVFDKAALARRLAEELERPPPDDAVSGSAAASADELLAIAAQQEEARRLLFAHGIAQGKRLVSYIQGLAGGEHNAWLLGSGGIADAPDPAAIAAELSRPTHAAVSYDMDVIAAKRPRQEGGVASWRISVQQRAAHARDVRQRRERHCMNIARDLLGGLCSGGDAAAATIRREQYNRVMAELRALPQAFAEKLPPVKITSNSEADTMALSGSREAADVENSVGATGPVGSRVDTRTLVGGEDDDQSSVDSLEDILGDDSV